MQPMQRNVMYHGAMEQYAHALPEKKTIRIPWGIIAGLIILAIVYFYITKYTLA